MILGLRMQLTPAQVEMLMRLYHNHYEEDKVMLPVGHDRPFFASTINRLKNMGLVSHNPRRLPSYLITDEGKALAELVIHHCQRIVDMKQQRLRVRQRQADRQEPTRSTARVRVAV
jgi:hypothetical protein